MSTPLTPTDQILTELTADPVPEPPKEEPKEEPKKKVRGRPFTKENAGAMARRGAPVKKARKDAREAMFRKLVSKVDLGDQLIRAINTDNEALMNILEKAVKMVGLHYDQSEEGKEQKLNVKSESEVKGRLEVTVTGLEDGV